MMQRIAQRGLIWIIALALVVAGLPMAHAKPEASVPIQATPMRAAMQHHVDMAQMPPDDHTHHHHDGMVMNTGFDQATSDQDDNSQPSPSAPCKCLNCSMCVASFVAAPLRLSTPERRIVAVTYRSAAAGVPGIAGRVDPGIPILAL